MTKEDAINLALEALRATQTAIGAKPVQAYRIEPRMRLRKNSEGWMAVVPLDVPFGFEPDMIHVEVYEPDGEVIIPDVL